MNATYIGILNSYPGQVLRLITNATMKFENDEDTTPTISPDLTDAPVPKSRRNNNKHGQRN